MKTEIALSNNLNKIEKLILDTEDPQNKTLEVITKSESEAKSLGERLLFMRNVYVSSDKYDFDCFTARLTSNRLLIKGDIRVAAELLGTEKFIDEKASEELKKHIGSPPEVLTPPRTDFFAEPSSHKSERNSSDEEEEGQNFAAKK